MRKLLLLLFVLSTSWAYAQVPYLITEADVLFENGEIKEFYRDESDIIIPPFLNGEEVTAIGDICFRLKYLTSVTLPNTLVTIGQDAFAYNKLTSITIPNSVTSIGENAFNRNSLTSVTLSNTLTTIGSYAFNKNSLTSVDIPNSVTSIGAYAFRENNLTDVNIPDGVIFIREQAFSNNELSSITIPNTVFIIAEKSFSDNVLSKIKLPTPPMAGTWSEGVAGDSINDLTIEYVYLMNNYTPSDDYFLFKNGVIIDYYGPGGDIIIPNTINEETVVAIGEAGFKKNGLTGIPFLIR